MSASEQAGTGLPISQKAELEGGEAEQLGEGASHAGTVFLTHMNVDKSEATELYPSVSDRL